MSSLANFYIPFDDNTLIDEVSATLPTVTGNTPAVVPAVFNDGWQMDGSTYASYSPSISITNGLTIGFWLSPVNLGMVTNPNTFATESLLMPVLSRSNFSFGGGIESATSEQFIIYEQTQSDGQNIMTVQLKGGTTATISSNPYTAGEFHYFWIVYNGTGPSCNIYIDLQDQTAGTSGTVPSTLSATAAPFAINLSVPGNGYAITRNQGIIDDLVLFNSAQANTVMNRAVKLGGNYVNDSTLSSADEISQVLVFDDSSTLTVISVASNNGSIYIAGSDGNILRGIRAMWQSRRNFNSDAEIELLDFVTRTGTTTLAIENGALHIKSEIVKI